MDMKDGKTKGMWHRRLSDFESFDRVELVVVPRYKTSGLSGDEWRQHVDMRFYFKGELVHERGVGTMQAAVMMLGSEYVVAQEPIPDRVIEMENEGYCCQPSCAEMSVGRFRLRKTWGPQGQSLDQSEVHSTYYAQFCTKHLRRGDCGLEDADGNYEPLDDVTADGAGFVVESPSVFGGVIDLTIK